MQTFRLTRNLLAALVLTCAAALGVLGQPISCGRGPISSQECKQLAQSASYVFEARRIDGANLMKLRPGSTMIPFLIVKNFRSKLPCDTIYFRGTEGEPSARDGVFFVDSIKDFHLDDRKTMNGKYVFTMFANYSYEFPLFEPSVRSHCGNFLNRKTFFEWLYQLPGITQHPLDSWKEVPPAELPNLDFIQWNVELDQMVGKAKERMLMKEGRELTKDELKGVRANYYRVYDSIMQVKHPDDKTYSWRATGVPLTYKSILWPEQYPPVPPVDNRKAAAVFYQRRRDSLNRIYDSLMILRPQDSIYLKYKYKREWFLREHKGNRIPIPVPRSGSIMPLNKDACLSPRFYCRFREKERLSDAG